MFYLFTNNTVAVKSTVNNVPKVTPLSLSILRMNKINVKSLFSPPIKLAASRFFIIIFHIYLETSSSNSIGNVEV